VLFRSNRTMKTHFVVFWVLTRRSLVGGHLHCDRPGYDADNNPNDHNRGDFCTANTRKRELN
jgi:hypothetical protein